MTKGCDCKVCELQRAIAAGVRAFMERAEREDDSVGLSVSTLINVMIDEIAADVLMGIEQSPDPRRSLASMRRALPDVIDTKLLAKARQHMPGAVATLQ